MESFVIIRKKDLEEEVSELIQRAARIGLGSEKPTYKQFNEIQALDWSFVTFLDSEFCTLTPRDWLNEIAFKIIEALHLTPKLDEKAGKWFYIFPNNAKPDMMGTILGYGNTVDEAARNFYQGMEGATAVNYLQNKETENRTR